MGFTAMNKKSNKNTTKSTGFKGKGKPSTKTNFVTVASVWTSDKSDSGFYALANKDRKDYKAPGRLLFEDSRTGDVYQINTISMFEPKVDVTGLAYNLVVNLDNPNSATKVGNSGDTASEEEADGPDYELANEDEEE